MIEYLKENYKIKTKQEMAKGLGISYNKVEWELRKLQLTKFKSKKYSDEEEQFLIENFPKFGAKYCAKHLNRSFAAVCKKIEKLKLKKNYKYNYISSQGYLVDSTVRNNKKLIHRQVMESYLGRKLRSNEIVHHIDGNKLNNDISNLCILSRSEHAKLHDNLGIYKKCQ